MGPPEDWQNPIESLPGGVQVNVEPSQLLPSRNELSERRLTFQRLLLESKQLRFTPILVTPDAVIYDGHHAVRAAAELSVVVDVLVVGRHVSSSGLSILELLVR